jgi:NADH-quinone oxidoreductase subunit I
MKHWIKAFSLVELFEGLFLTLRIMFRAKPTVRYPEERTPYSPRFRGMHALMKTRDGAERCIGCKLCEAACPSQAITIVSGANADGKRCAVSYEIDQGKCIFCGICEEACPVDAIVHTKQFEYIAEQREGLRFPKETLLMVGDSYQEEIEAAKAADARYR